jgi:hypothetical protein
VERLRDLVSAERAPMARVVNVPLTEVLIELVKAKLGIGLLSKCALSGRTWAPIPA